MTPPAPTTALPQWTRLPQAGQKCPYTGLGRVRLVRLLAQADTEIAFTRLRRTGGRFP